MNRLDSKQSLELDDLIRARYPSEGGLLISQELGLPFSTVRARAYRLKISSVQRYKRQAQNHSLQSKSVDTQYFQGPWTEEMAYLVGYIYADGCNNEKAGAKGKAKGKTNRSLDFHCQEGDRDLIVLIKSLLKSTHKISELPERYDPKKDSWSGKSVQLQISNTHLAKSLEERFGVAPRKSYQDLPFPKLPEGFFRDFVRGYSDGDGHSSTTCFGYYGTRQFIVGLTQRLLLEVPVREPTLFFSDLWGVRWQNVPERLLLYKWLYDPEPKLFLPRKRESWGW